MVVCGVCTVCVVWCVVLCCVVSADGCMLEQVLSCSKFLYETGHFTNHGTADIQFFGFSEKCRATFGKTSAPKNVDQGTDTCEGARSTPSQIVR